MKDHVSLSNEAIKAIKNLTSNADYFHMLVTSHIDIFTLLEVIGLCIFLLISILYLKAIGVGILYSRANSQDQI